MREEVRVLGGSGSGEGLPAEVQGVRRDDCAARGRDCHLGADAGTRHRPDGSADGRVDVVHGHVDFHFHFRDARAAGAAGRDGSGPPPPPSAVARSELPAANGSPTSGALGSPRPAPSPADTALDLDPLVGDPASSTERPLSATDPFAAAARASLPDDYGTAAGGAAPDPIAALSRDPGAPPPRREPTPPPTFSAISKPERERSSAALVLLGIGLLLLVAVLVFAVMRGKIGDGAAAPAGPATQAPAAEHPAKP